MMVGEVNSNGQAVVPIQVSGPTGQARAIEAVIDTGFSDYLALSAELISALALPYTMTRAYELGDGNIVAFDIHGAMVLWEGEKRTVDAVVTKGGSLIGMALLANSRLIIDVVAGGEVRIELRP